MLITYIAVAFLVFVGIMVFTAPKDKKQFAEDFEEILTASLVAGVVISLVSFILVHSLFSNFIPCDARTEKVPLCALTDNYYVDSRFPNDGQTVYRYLAESDKGFQITSKEIADRYVYFKYTDDTPYLEITSEYFRNGWWDIFFARSGKKHYANEYYVFHVPQNSIATELEIDLE